jgi:hypothetical protein
MSEAGERKGKSSMQVKVYLVCQRRNLVPPGEPNVRILAAKLTRAGAEEIRRVTPGTYILRLDARK